MAREHAYLGHPEETHQRLSSALDQVTEAIAILDARDGSLLYRNPMFSTLFGGPTHRSSRPVFTTMFECPLLARALEQALAGHGWTGHCSVKTPAGKHFTFDGAVAPVLTFGGRVDSLVLRFRDISLELEKDHHLRQAQKMDALGVLAGGMAHDFNNLIGAILNTTELIELQLEPGNPIQKKLALIQQVGSRARELSAQILNYSRRTDDQWIPFDLTRLAEEVISLLKITFPKNIELRCDLTQGIWIHGNPSQLHQAIMNLGINGSQAMQPGGGTLSIRLMHEDVDPRVVDQLYPEPCVLLTIEDTGCGMDAPTLERIFEPFFTTKEMGHGTGLGLSVVYDIIQGHSGNLHVTSEPGKGSSFKIRLPLHQETPRPSLSVAPVIRLNTAQPTLPSWP